MLLKHTGYLDAGDAQHFLGRNLKNYGSYIGVDLDSKYVEDLLAEVNMTKCNPAETTGSNSNKSSSEDVDYLDHISARLTEDLLENYRSSLPHDQASATQHRKSPGAYATDACAKHLLKYLRGASNY